MQRHKISLYLISTRYFRRGDVQTKISSPLRALHVFEFVSVNNIRIRI
jgi:hypothetical protein